MEITAEPRGPKAVTLARVAEVANCVLGSAAFRAEVSAIPQFRSTELSGPEVLARLDETPVCSLSTFRRGGAFGYFMYWDRVDASTPVGSSRVRFNLNTFRDDLTFLTGTAIHECAHVAGFTHRYNDRVRHPEIERSVPYQLGFIAERHAQACARATEPGDGSQ